MWRAEGGETEPGVPVPKMGRGLGVWSTPDGAKGSPGGARISEDVARPPSFSAASPSSPPEAGGGSPAERRGGSQAPPAAAAAAGGFLS